MERIAIEFSRFWAFCLLVSLILGASSYCAADEVLLQNGDRITGRVVSVEDGKLAIKTEYAGTLKLDWTKVKEVQTDQPLTVQAHDSKKLQTTKLLREDGAVLLSSGEGQNLQVPANSVSAIRSQSEQRAYEAALRPGLFQGWLGEVNVGFAFASGNSEVTNLSSGINGSRQTFNDKVTFYTNSVYSTDRTLAAVTANAIRGGFRYDKDFSPGWFGFGSADFEYDDLQNLDLRAINGGGLGWHAIRASSSTLDLLGGTVWTRELYTFAPQRDFLAGKFGEELNTTLWPGSELKQSAFYIPDFEQTSQYRVSMDLALSSRINSWLSWQTAVSERYSSNPPLGSKPNDLLITTGVGFRLGHKLR
jgi:putative salt-induced outer membrane protein YdiY